MTLDNIDFTININYLILTILLVLGIGYTYFSYRFTIPTTTNFIKTTLIVIRTLALVLIIGILFEPILFLNFLQKNEPTNLLLIDNSSSIVNKDSINRSENVHKFIENFKNSVNGNIKIATFGKHIKFLENYNEVNIPFDESATNFENIASFVKVQNLDISSITIVSDGIITDGSNSTNDLEKLNIPIFTIAVGDTSKQSDIAINKAEFNKIIYLKTKTEINGVISNQNFANKNVMVSLFDKSGLVAQKPIKLNEFGINNVSFEYEANEIGKQNLTLKISQLEKEITYENNKYHFTIEVLDDKTNVLLISGSPSPDLTIISKSLSTNENIKLNKIIQIADNKFLETSNTSNLTSKIDSADVIIMLDFPTNKTPQNLVKTVFSNVETKNTPFFLILSELTDFNQLSKFQNILPFKIKNTQKDFPLIQPEIISEGGGIIQNPTNWGKLAPIRISNIQIEAKDKSSILAIGRQKNDFAEIPLLFTQKVGNSRRIVLNGFNFWKWKLQPEANLQFLFDSFLQNSVKWLSTKKDKQIFVSTTKDIFNSGEIIEFVGNIYDETSTPINDALIEIEIYSDNFKDNLKLNSTKNGIYDGSIEINKLGNFNYKAKITLRNGKIDLVEGKFFISDVKIENINFVLNSNYLKFISDNSSGKSFGIKNYSELFSKIEKIFEINNVDKVISTKYELWYDKWILLLIVFLFAIEWTIRKKIGML